MDYKYTTTFEALLLPCEINEASLISKASLENLEPLVPKDINYESNKDLLGVAFNAAVVNKFNKNGDGMDTSTAVRYTKNFIHKPTNIEHDKQKVVGHIVSAGYSDFASSRLLGEPFRLSSIHLAADGDVGLSTVSATSHIEVLDLLVFAQLVAGAFQHDFPHLECVGICTVLQRYSGVLFDG